MEPESLRLLSISPGILRLGERQRTVLLNFTQQVRRVTADTFSGNFDRLDDTLRVNNKGCTVCQTFVFTHVVEVTGQGASRVADHRIFDFCDSFRAAVPCFVREVSIG